MMRSRILVLALVAASLAAQGQQQMVLADSATRLPVPYARVSLPGKSRVLSSEEGRVALPGAQRGDTLFISHLSYN